MGKKSIFAFLVCCSFFLFVFALDLEVSVLDEQLCSSFDPASPTLILDH
jgi:hypothetical protein